MAANELDAEVVAWVQHPKTGVITKVVHADTITRCRLDGFVFVPDPNAPTVATPTDDDPLPATVPPAVAPDAEALAAVEAAQVAAIRERNTAARTAFGMATPPDPAPAPTVRQPGGGGVKRERTA